MSVFWQSLLEQLNIISCLTSPYHSQEDGQMERTQRTWLQYLRMYAKEKDWVSWLAPMELVYNLAVHESIGLALFNVTRTYRPLCGTEPQSKENN